MQELLEFQGAGGAGTVGVSGRRGAGTVGVSVSSGAGTVGVSGSRSAAIFEVSVSKGCRNCCSFCEQGVQEQLVFLGARGAGTVLIKAVTEVLVPTFEE